MKFIKIFIQRPGRYLYYMFLWVLIGIPGEYHIVTSHYPRGEYTVKYAAKFIIPFAMCLVTAPFLNVLVRSMWEKYNILIRSIVLISLYSILAWLASLFTMALHEYGYVKYVGDIFGTIIVFYWPTAIAYWIIGIPTAMYLKKINK